jgi:hypothetical protein
LAGSYFHPNLAAMSYYIRVLGTQNPDIHLDEIIEALDYDDLTVRLAISKSEKPEKWTFLELRNEDEEVLAVIERDVVSEGTIGKEELEEFKESILNFQPLSAAKWLDKFFDRVKVIYAFKLMPIALEDENYPIITSTQSHIWDKVNGILQADEEGFSNEDGYHILWQFPEDADGAWNCAVLNAEGKWENFNMDLADENQRKEFKEGAVPAGAKRV